MHVPVDVLNRVTSDGFDWQVHGLRDDLVIALIRSPAQGDPATLRAGAGPRRRPGGSCASAARPVRRAAHRRAGPGGPRAHGVADRPAGLGRRPGADHLRITFSVDGRRAVGSSPAARTSTRCARPPSPSCAGRCPGPGASLERSGLRTWSVGEVPETFETRSAAGRLVQGYPALVDDGHSVALRVLPDPGRGGRRAPPGGAPAAAAQRHPARGSRCWPGSRNAQKLALAAQPARVGARPAPGLPRRAPSTRSSPSTCRERCAPAAAFAAALDAVRAHARRPGAAGRRGGRAGPGHAAPVRAPASAGRDDGAARSPRLVADVRAQLDSWCGRGSSRRPGSAGCATCDRYLRGDAAPARARRRPTRATRGRRATGRLPAEAAYADLLESLRPTRRASDDVVAHRLDGRGAAGLPVRPDPRHRVPGVGEAGAHGHRGDRPGADRRGRRRSAESPRRRGRCPRTRAKAPATIVQWRLRPPRSTRKGHAVQNPSELYRFETDADQSSCARPRSCSSSPSVPSSTPGSTRAPRRSTCSRPTTTRSSRPSTSTSCSTTAAAAR